MQQGGFLAAEALFDLLPDEAEEDVAQPLVLPQSPELLAGDPGGTALGVGTEEGFGEDGGDGQRRADGAIVGEEGIGLPAEVFEDVGRVVALGELLQGFDGEEGVAEDFTVLALLPVQLLQPLLGVLAVEIDHDLEVEVGQEKVAFGVVQGTHVHLPAGALVGFEAGEVILAAELLGAEAVLDELKTVQGLVDLEEVLVVGLHGGVGGQLGAQEVRRRKGQVSQIIVESTLQDGQHKTVVRRHAVADGIESFGEEQADAFFGDPLSEAIEKGDT